MAAVQRGLVAGIAVDRGHQTAFDADGLMHHFRQRREAVGGAGAVGDHRLCRQHFVIVHAEHHRAVHVLARCGQ